MAKLLQGKVIPFELVKGIVLIPGKADGVPGHFALDTGATQTVLNKTHCGAADAKTREAITFDNGTQNSALASKERALLEIEGEEIERNDPALMDMTYVETPLRSEKAGLVFLGSIGADLLGTGRLVVDYIHKKAVTANPRWRSGFGRCSSTGRPYRRRR